MDAREIWFGRSPLAVCVRLLLLPLSAIYWIGWQTYLLIYRLGLKKAFRLQVVTICVGNFSVGGSGKSPLTLHLARLLKKLGYQVVLGCSGYGSPRAGAASVAPEGDLDAAEWGDEPAMFRYLVPEFPIIVGRRRVLAAQLCAERFPKAVLLMDDGLQHMPLAVDVRIAIDDPANPNRFVLPAGPYREPRSITRADLILPGEFAIAEEPGGFSLPTGETVAHAGARVNVLCALGRPDKFVDALRNQGLEIASANLLPDHDPLSAGTIWNSFEPELPIVVTVKDWVKLRRRDDLTGRTIWIARHAVRVEPVEDFERWLHEKTQKAVDEKGRP